MDNLDQFFTRATWARSCLRCLGEILLSLGVGGLKGDILFVEPSAGNGDFSRQLPKARTIAMDVEPRQDGMLRQDFLSWSGGFSRPNRTIVVVGNPPFGRRSSMAVRFFNAAAGFADVIAFVVPVSFRKYPIHKQLNAEFCWVGQRSLPRDAFYTLDSIGKKRCLVNTEFQVWTSVKHSMVNRRLFSAPPREHVDFSMHQYNNTSEAEKVFGLPFDFAVPSQGWQDYTRRETNPNNCERQKQWMLFKATSKGVFDRLHAGLDYEQLAMTSATAVPGFRKNDVVRQYNLQYGSG